MSVNKVILVGHVGQDPVIRFQATGEPIANISIATTERWKSKTGEKQEKTEWHRVSLFGKLAEIVQQHVKKGTQLYIEGKLQTRKYQDKTGRDTYSTEIVANIMEMLGSKTGISAQTAPVIPPANPDNFADDIPF